MVSVPNAEMHDDVSRLVLAGIEKLRAKLLDLSLGNRLINFKHSERSRTHIRVIDEAPEILFDKLEQGRKPTFSWIEEPESNLSDEQTPEFRAALAEAKESDAVYLEQRRALGRRSSSRQLHRIERELRDRIRQQFDLPPRTEGTIAERAKELGINPNYDLPHLTDQSSQQRPSSKIQTLHYREQMESKLSAIRDSDRTLLQDAGIAALYCAFGFVEWYETAESETSLYAPLLLYPVEIQRELQGGRYTYTLEFRDEDIEPNITLAELFRTNFGLELPAWDPDSNLTDYFAKLERLISERRKWRLRRWVTVGLFTFAKLIEFQDLDPRNWRPNTALEKHTVLQDLLAGTESVAEAPLAPEHPIDSPSIAKKGLLLVTDADSSQHSAVIDVLDGKNLVIQGPPGTGKSQTITNIIAAALGAGKTVLFIAEKMAALEVVKSRLDHFGLGQFCLEIHSSKTRKTSVLQSLKERLEFSGPQFDLNQLEQAVAAAEQARNDLLYYVDRMKQQFGRTGLTTQEVLRGNIVRAGHIPEFLPWLKRIRINQVGELDRFIVQEVRDLAYELEKQALNVNLWDGLIHHPWRGFQNDQLDALRFDDLTEALRSWSESAEALRKAIADAVATTKWPIPVSVRGAQDFATRVRSIPELPCGFAEDVFRQLRTAKDLALLRECNADLEELTTLSAQVSQFSARADLLIGVETSSLQALVNELKELEFAGLTLEGIKEATEDRRKKTEAFEEALPGAQRLAELFGIADASIDDLGSMTRAIVMLQQVPRNALQLRHPSVVAEENIAVFERGLLQAEALTRASNRLRAEFELALVPPLTQVKKAARDLASSGFLGRMLRKECREARRLYRSTALRRPRIGRRSAASALSDLAAFLDQLSKLETDADFKKAAGSHFKGMQTPWHELVAISRWSQKARQALPLVGGHVNAIRDFLFSANPDQIDALLALAIKPEFQKLHEGLTTASAFPSSRLQALSIEQRKITTRSEEALRQLEAFGLSPTTSVTAFEQLVNVVSVAQQLKQKLSRPEVVQLLGPDIDARSAVGAQLRPTLEFADQLAKIDVPELARVELMQSSISDGLRQLSHHAAILLERAASARCAQESARSIAKLDGPSFIGTEDFLDIAPDALAARIEFALKHVDALQPYIDFLRLGNRAKATALAPILKAFAESGMDYLRLAEAFEFVLYRSAADAILQDDPRLSSHSGATHEQLRKRFQQLDRKILELRRQQIVQRLMTRYVDPGISRGKASELTGKGLLYRQIGLQKRHIALRELFARAGQAILALKPCLMMSPMSVARFLDPRGLRFDLAVMDEASQIRPEDAIGAIARGAQVVVVGDPMQLPPTSFFEKLDADGAPDDNPDDVGVQDLTGQESILDIAQSAYQPVRQLRWHYRSRHESLIAFSNREFYQDSLVVFPSPHGNDPRFGVQLVEVNGTYEGSLNRLEAEAVVNAAQDFMHQDPQRSLGIVAMNQPQRDLIASMMDDLFASDPVTEAYRINWMETLESPFVKNLENVQGDERDVIFISTVYGKDPSGNFYQRLGPINGVHGHRRLNVLFTRAKQQVRIFTCMKSMDLRVDETTRPGVAALKNYLQFAKDGHLDYAKLSGREPDSEFERWVIQRLREKGYEVVPQLGVAGYFIDIAVRDPDRRGSFVLGVECDGAMYHSALSVRDRDRLRQEVLERLGWTIYRIWSTDWFRNPAAELQKLIAKVEQMRRPVIPVSVQRPPSNASASATP